MQFTIQRAWLLCLITFTASLGSALPSPIRARGEESIPHLRRQGQLTQLIVDGQPFIMLAGEVHNSSSSGLDYLARIWPKLKQLNLNTVLAPFGIESVEADYPLAESYALLQQLIPQISAAAVSNRLAAVYQQDEAEDQTAHPASACVPA